MIYRTPPGKWSGAPGGDAPLGKQPDQGGRDPASEPGGGLAQVSQTMRDRIGS